MSEPIRMSINIQLYQPGSGGNIRVEEVIELPITDFMGLAGIMSRFHELAKEIKQQSGVKR
jgi:hypothetical protein